MGVAHAFEHDMYARRLSEEIICFNARLKTPQVSISYLVSKYTKSMLPKVETKVHVHTFKKFMNGFSISMRCRSQSSVRCFMYRFRFTRAARHLVADVWKNHTKNP